MGHPGKDGFEYPVQRYLRDVRFTLIGGGTSEILKLRNAWFRQSNWPAGEQLFLCISFKQDTYE
jgi:hypothetical protein